MTNSDLLDLIMDVSKSDYDVYYELRSLRDLPEEIQSILDESSGMDVGITLDEIIKYLRENKYE